GDSNDGGNAVCAKLPPLLFVRRAQQRIASGDFVAIARGKHDAPCVDIRDDDRALFGIGWGGERPSAAFGAAIAISERDPIIAGERAHPAASAVEQRLPAAVRQAGDEAADTAEALAEAAIGRDSLENHATVAELECDIDQVMLIGQPDRISPPDARGS